MKVIGIVGGIASGKSTVAKCFQRLGGFVLDADRIGHDVLRLESVKNDVRQEWGEGVFDQQGEIHRPAMAATVFGSDAASRARLARLEQITHPWIADRLREEIERLRRAATYPAVILDAPVLIKAGWHRFCNHIVFVESNAESRERRARQRGWSSDEWRRREDSQPQTNDVRKWADATLVNNSSLAELERQVLELWQRWGLCQSASPTPDAMNQQ